MPSISLSKQISIGFAIILLAMIIMGVIAISSMSKAISNSKTLDAEYIEEVSIVTSLERNYAKGRIEIVKFLYSEDLEFIKAAQKHVLSVYERLNELKEFSAKYPNLKVLAKDLPIVEAGINEYKVYAQEVEALIVKKKELQKELDEKAIAFTEHAQAVLKSQQKQMRKAA
ncbi:MAG: hypothetical protein PHS42_00485 [Sulfurimonas sp.]|nr:hypothetical protein [Sulfurimonas sp.]MDD3833921.1 hypothetical protein [Sulfurimonas sp.]